MLPRVSDCGQEAFWHNGCRMAIRKILPPSPERSTTLSPTFASSVGEHPPGTFTF